MNVIRDIIMVIIIALLFVLIPLLFIVVFDIGAHLRELFGRR
ncbi:MAG TPA: hypothetical protein VKU87_10805 [Thermomicrobiaceae bacterium]|nr:hypothetical protein [Thermomicrobiaceae bacterium]